MIRIRAVVLTAAILAVIPAATAHAGLDHTYNSVSVVSLIILLWIGVAVYEEIGDTVLGHWILFSAVFAAFYIPAIDPHIRIDHLPFSSITVLGAGVVVIGVATWILHRSGYLPRTQLSATDGNQTNP